MEILREAEVGRHAVPPFDQSLDRRRALLNEESACRREICRRSQRAEHTIHGDVGARGTIANPEGLGVGCGRVEVEHAVRVGVEHATGHRHRRLERGRLERLGAHLPVHGVRQPGGVGDQEPDERSRADVCERERDIHVHGGFRGGQDPLVGAQSAVDEIDREAGAAPGVVAAGAGHVQRRPGHRVVARRYEIELRRGVVGERDRGLEGMTSGVGQRDLQPLQTVRHARQVERRAPGADPARAPDEGERGRPIGHLHRCARELQGRHDRQVHLKLTAGGVRRRQAELGDREARRKHDARLG